MMPRPKKVVDEITYRVILEKGRLVPAFASDAEKLDSWRDGSKLIVTLKRDGTNPLVDKFHALIGDAIKGGNTPWTNMESAKSAIKWALGMIDVTRSVDKDGKVGPLIPQELSLNAFTDVQLTEFIEQEIALLYRLTGVDWEKEYRERSGREPFVPDYPPPESSDNPTAPHAVSDEGRSRPQDSTPMTEGAAAHQSTDPTTEAGTPAIMPDAEVGSAGNPASKSAVGATSSSGEEELAAGVGDGAVSPPAADKEAKAKADKTKPRTKGDLNGADAAWLLGLARRLVAATEPKSGRQYVHLLSAAAQNAKDHYPPGGLGAKTKEVAGQLYNLCFDISLGTVPMDMKMISTLAGCSVADLKTPETKS